VRVSADFVDLPEKMLLRTWSASISARALVFHFISTIEKIIQTLKISIERWSELG
jgi:hypothetical protein